MKRLIYFICGLMILSACNNSNKIEITGTIENGDGKDLKFSELLVSGTEDIKTVKLDKNGNFKFKTNTDIPRFYNLSVSNNNFITLLVEPGESVNVLAKANNLSQAKIQGSESSLLVQKINNQLSNTHAKLDSIINYIESIKNTEKFNQEIDDLNKSYADIVNAQRDSSIAFIITNIDNIASIVALYQKYDTENFVLYKNRDLQYIKIVSESLQRLYPESPHVKYLLADKENLLKRYNQLKTNQQLDQIVSKSAVHTIPEVYLPDQTGDSISLNSVRAKYILLNFWASWSQESTKRNLQLKEIYNKYHTKGFEIYSVSLDTKKENWTRAINFDQLPWVNVVDLNGRTSYYAKIYNVSTLPTSFLINPEGELVMKNPSNKQLISTFDYALK